MKKSILIAALILLVIGTSCSSTKTEKEINQAIEESKKASEEIKEISEDYKEIDEELSSKFDDNANKDLTGFSKEETGFEDEKNLGEDDDDFTEENEPEDPKDLGFLSYNGVYFGVWTTQQGFSAPLSITVSGGTVTGFADFFMTLPGGQSNSHMAFQGTVNDDGLMEGILTGSGVLTGNNMASTMDMTGTFLGPIKANTMTINYNSTALTYIKNYGTVTNTDGGIITLKKVGTP